jgi:transposase InsO family protein
MTSISPAHTSVPLPPVVIKNYGSRRTIWLRHSYVMDAWGEDMSENLMRKNRSIATLDENRIGTAWRWCKMDGHFFYDYEGITDRAPKKYRSRLPSESELVNMGRNPYNADDLRERIVDKIRQEANSYIRKDDITYYMYDAPQSLPYQQAFEAVRALGFARLFHFYSAAFVRLGLESKKDFYSVAAEVLATEELRNFKTTTAESFRLRLAEFHHALQQGKEREFFLSNKLGNTNRSIVGKAKIVDGETGELMTFDIHETAIFLAWLNIGGAAKQFKTYAWEFQYCPMVKQLGIDPVSYTSFCRHTDSFHNKALSAMELHGNAYFGHKYLPYVPCEPLRFKDTLWVADGSGMKEQYRTPSGKPATLYGVLVADVASGFILGLQITRRAEGESAEAVQKAFAQAWVASGGWSPADLLSDNGGGFTNGDTEERLTVALGKKPRTTNLGKSQENPAEVIVKLFNTMARQSEHWAGQYQAKDIHYKANPDYQDLRSLPTETEAYERVMARVQAYNDQKGGDGLSRRERYQQLTRNPKAHKPEPVALRRAWSWRTTVDLDWQRGFVNITKDSQPYQYTIPNYHANLPIISKALGFTGDARVEVCHDGDFADLYTPDGKYILTCEATERGFKSLAEATPENVAAHEAHRTRVKEFTNSAKEFRDGIVEAAEAIEYGSAVAFAPKKKVKKEAQIDKEADAVESMYHLPPAPKDTRTIEERAFDEL